VPVKGVRPGKLSWIGKPRGSPRPGMTLPPALPTSAQITNAPRAAQIGSVDVVANLLLTTLAVVAATLPPGKQLNDSAPAPRYQASCEQQIPLIPSQIRLPPRAGQWSESAPQPKYQVQCEPQPNPIPTQIRLPPRAGQLSDSAPARAAIGSDQSPNLLETTLRPVAGAPFVPQDFPQVPTKAQVSSDYRQNPIPSQIPPPPRAGQLSESAPVTKFAVQCEQQPNPVPSQIRLPPRAQQLSDSAPIIKYQVQCEPQPNPIPSQIALPQRAQQSSESAPYRLSVGFELYPNLLLTTLAPIGAAPFLPVDFSQYQAKYQLSDFRPPNLLLTTLAPAPQPPPPQATQTTFAPIAPCIGPADQFVNTLVLGYPPPDVVTPPVTGPINYGGGGAGKRHYKYRKPCRRIDEWMCDVEHIYGELRGTPRKAVAAEVVRDYAATRAKAPLPTSVDWQALEANEQAVASLVALYRAKLIEDDDEDVFLLGG
jgi:hypothetical protein